MRHPRLAPLVGCAGLCAASLIPGCAPHTAAGGALPEDRHAASGATPSAVGTEPGPLGPGAASVAAMPDALESTSAVAAAPTVESWQFGEVQGELIQTSHYRLHSTLSNRSLRRVLPSYFESALAHYRSTLGELPSPPKPLETYLFGARSQWSAFTQERLGPDAGTYLGLGRGGYTLDAQAILYDIGRFDTLAIAAHEGWHQYTQATFRHALPIWLEEGLATYMEGHVWDREHDRAVFQPWRNFERFGALRDAVNDDELIPLDELLDGYPQGFLQSGRDRLLTYYAQVWALSQFLAEGENGRYRDALEQLLQDAAHGRIAGRIATSPNLPRGRPRALASKLGRTIVLVYFDADFASFKKGYEEFVRTITRRGAGEAIWRGESPLNAGDARTRRQTVARE